MTWILAKLRDYGTQKRLLNLEKRFPRAFRRELLREANVLSKDIRQGIIRQAPGGKAFTPLAKSTIAMKGSSKALIDNGASGLLGSIGVSEHGETVFVGVNRNAKDKDGETLHNIAQYQEEGTRPYTIPITDKMRRFFFAMYKRGIFNAPLPKTRTRIRHPGIPARPYMQPAFEQWNKGINDRMIKKIDAVVARLAQIRPHR